ncbi:RNA-binding S4 domain-containing protein [Zhaonella formicivorans]|uniref:RNA-binding S4 domain-containing protein n=1 Tax=Zhaonella formicivorans TaxID=2528593 RepID=UPI0010DF6CFC|nr:RNA-binding S4 domain-containing protein [Zhaonella formicivorans]
MRLDKYLKNSRIIKRRTVAKEVCDSGRVMLNGRAAKAGSEVNAGDILTIDLGVKVLEVKILATPEVVKANEAKDLYELIREQNKDLA